MCVCVFCVYTVPENLVNPELGSDYFGDSRSKVYGFIGYPRLRTQFWEGPQEAKGRILGSVFRTKKPLFF